VGTLTQHPLTFCGLDWHAVSDKQPAECRCASGLLGCSIRPRFGIERDAVARDVIYSDLNPDALVGEAFHF
jgi:hypothetical protein